MMARLSILGRRWLTDATEAASAIVSAITDFGCRWLSDAHVRDHEPEFWLAMRHALFIGLPVVLIGLGFMAMLP